MFIISNISVLNSTSLSDVSIISCLYLSVLSINASQLLTLPPLICSFE
nr:MAG TPA: hypothetical protein [Caudoviricetes sp.]